MEFPRGLEEFEVPDDCLYLEKLKQLRSAYPALGPFIAKLLYKNDEGHRLVEDYYKRNQGKTPGRCTMLAFNESNVEQPVHFDTARDLEAYLKESSSTAKTRRLFILEDMEARFVDRLGHYLGVDPLVFSEHMNTWNFTDTQSVPFRELPSLHTLEKSFNIRYYEVRTLEDGASVEAVKSQSTLAINRRKFERWRDIDTPSAQPSQRHAFIRRCASFWTSDHNPGHGWNAVLLVDPGMNLTASPQPGCARSYILQDPTEYKERKMMWDSKGWEETGSVVLKAHYSRPYHEGCPTLAPLLMNHIDKSGQDQLNLFSCQRDNCSPFDELVFYWTKVASTDLIKQAYQQSSNSAYYLLKFIAYHWINQLDLICTGVAQAEYFADDHQVKIDGSTSKQWREALNQLNDASKDINYMRRQMNHFERAMALNLERLGVQLGNESVDEKLSQTLQDAQKDFLTINARLKPFRERVDDLAGVANDLSNLRAAFKSIQDGEFGLRLSIFASIVFPVTLVASILSMGGNFAPGEGQFWIFWVASVPSALLFAMLLVYGRKPHEALKDLRAYTRKSPQSSRSKEHVFEMNKLASSSSS